jgi:hypothetical protein
VKKTLSILAIAALLVASGMALAHPHFNKTITVQLPSGTEATIAYNTTPANMEHARNAAVGSFITPRGPRLKLSAPVTVGSVTIPAGEHTIGVVKNGDNDWTMALYNGGLARGAEPDMSKVVKLDSMYTSEMGNAEHMLIDISPGHGKFEGKAVLTLHFGTMYLEGALS